MRSLPAGTTPPLIISYSASTTPLIQLGLSSKTLPEQQLYDLGQNFLRTSLVTVKGAATPYPYGGKIRQIQVDIDPPKLQSYNLAPADIVNAMNAQNLILPGGTAKIGPSEYDVEMNGSPRTIGELNDLPVRTSERRHPLHARRGACARRLSAADQYCASDGQRGSLMTILKIGNASTLDIVKGVKRSCRN